MRETEVYEWKTKWKTKQGVTGCSPQLRHRQAAWAGLHSGARRAKWQVEFLPEKCSHAGPLSLLLSLSFSSCGSAAFSLLFRADAAAMCCYCGRRESERPTHTHTHTDTNTHSHRFSRSALESKTQKLLAAYHFFFPLHFFFFGLCA